MENSFYGKLIEDLGPLPSNVPCWMQEICNGDVRNNPCTLRYVPDFLKIEEMCNEAMRNMPCMLLFVPGHLETQEMCIKAAKVDPWLLGYVHDHFKTQEMCIKAVWLGPTFLQLVLDHFKIRGMCEIAVKKRSWALKLVPDWFVTQGQIKLWHDDYYNDAPGRLCEDKFFEWYDGYQKRKVQRASIKEELLPIAWHPLRWWDWCVPEDEKKETEKLFLTIWYNEIKNVIIKRRCWNLVKKRLQLKTSMDKDK